MLNVQAPAGDIGSRDVWIDRQDRAWVVRAIDWHIPRRKNGEGIVSVIVLIDRGKDLYVADVDSAAAGRRPGGAGRRNAAEAQRVVECEKGLPVHRLIDEAAAAP